MNNKGDLINSRKVNYKTKASLASLASLLLILGLCMRK